MSVQKNYHNKNIWQYKLYKIITNMFLCYMICFLSNEHQIIIEKTDNYY